MITDVNARLEDSGEMRFLYFGFLLAAICASAPAKEPAAGLTTPLISKCNSPESDDFDFWIGRWDLHVRQRIGPESEEFREGRAVASVRRILDGCVMLEEFDGDTLPRPFVGISISTFNSRTGKWQQTWADNSANNMVFHGGYTDDRMEMVHEAKDDGESTLWRITFHNIRENDFDWAYDRSTDGGKTWLNFLEIHYTRNTGEPII